MLLLHVALGLASHGSKWVLSAWILGVGLFAGIRFLRARGQRRLWILLSVVTYLCAFEPLARIRECTPYPPWEMSKYLLAGASLLGLAFFPRLARSYGLVLVLVLLPAVFVRPWDGSTWNSVVFNLLGPLSLALGVALWSGRGLQQEALARLFRLLWYPLLAFLVYLLVYWYINDLVQYQLASIPHIAGRLGANQAATVLGLATLLGFSALLLRIPLSGNRWMDVALTVLFSWACLLTFSRGGYAAALLVILALSLAWLMQVRPLQVRPLLLPALAFAGIMICFGAVQLRSKGKLLNRYAGETYQTLEGRKPRSWSTLTSGRDTMMVQDIRLFTEHPFLGVGIGRSMDLRSPQGKPAAPHTEFTRLLSEHGLFGLAYALLLLFLGIRIWRSPLEPPQRLVLFSLYALALLSSLHSAMRTFVTPLLVVIASLGVRREE